jgi:ankyrin repeat protein
LCSNHYTRKSLDLLVKHGAEIEATTTDIGTQDNIFGIYFERDYGVTPFQVAIRRDRLATAILLRRHGAKMVFEPRRPPGPLYTTLKWRPDMSPLHLAVSSNPPDHDLIQYLLDQGADVNARDDLGRTPIFYALVDIHDDDGIRDMLFTAGADPAIQDNDGRTALYHAVDHPFEESNPFYIVDLLRAGAPLNVADNTGSTPLHIAAKHCDENVFYYLLDYGADVMVKDGKGDTPAHVAARQHAGFDAMMAFVEKGGRAVLEARNERQWTPVDLVRRSRNRVKRDITDQIEW